MPVFLMLFLLVFALFIKFQLRPVRHLLEHRDKLLDDLGLRESYTTNIQVLLELHADHGIAEAVMAHVEGSLVLYGYNSITKFLIKEIEKQGGNVKKVIEENETVREKNKGKNVDLISLEEAEKLLTDDEIILICSLHKRAYGMAHRISTRLNGRWDIVLLEEVLRHQRGT